MSQKIATLSNPENWASHRHHVMCRVHAQMENHDVDAIVTFSAENLYYLTGVAGFYSYSWTGPGMAGAVLSIERPERVTYVTAEMEAAALYDHDDIDIAIYPLWMSIDDPYGERTVPSPQPTDGGIGFEGLVRLVKAATGKGKKIAIEMDGLSQSAIATMQGLFRHQEVVDAVPLFDEAKLIKSSWEQAAMRRAVEITESAISAACASISHGSNQRLITQAFERHIMNDDDANGIRLSMISTGTQFAPYRYGVRKPIQPGELIKFDVGAEVLGYGADMARTFCFGVPSDDARRAYDALRAGHDFLLERLGPGVEMAGLFEATMKVVRSSGLPGYTRGHVGHSLGLGRIVEEPPFLGARAKRCFEPGMMFSVETPYYAYGLGAFQCEDVVIIEDSGHHNLCKLSRDLVTLPIQ